MSFQDCLIKWISNTSDYHTHVLNQLPCVCKANMFQLTIYGSEMWQPFGLFSMTFRDFSGPRPNSTTFQAWKIWILNSMTFFYDLPGSVRTLLHTNAQLEEKVWDTVYWHMDNWRRWNKRCCMVRRVVIGRLMCRHYLLFEVFQQNLCPFVSCYHVLIATKPVASVTT